MGLFPFTFPSHGDDLLFLFCAQGQMSHGWLVEISMAVGKSVELLRDRMQKARAPSVVGILRLRLFVALAAQRTVLAQDDRLRW